MSFAEEIGYLLTLCETICCGLRMSGTGDVGFEDLHRCPFTSADAPDNFRCCEPFPSLSRREAVRS